MYVDNVLSATVSYCQLLPISVCSRYVICWKKSHLLSLSMSATRTQCDVFYIQRAGESVAVAPVGLHKSVDYGFVSW